MTEKTKPPVRPGATLAIVDVHPRYLDGLPNPVEIVDAVVFEVERFKRLGHAVLDVQYGRQQPTHERVRNAIAGSIRPEPVIKEQSDGSAEISRVCTDERLGTEVIRVCGVYAWACVYWTVVGLAKLYPNSRIEVVPTACGFRESDYEIFQLNHIPGNVHILFHDYEPAQAA